MKKIIIALFIVMVLLLINSNESKNILIPSDAIRFRIIASSNKFSDQEEKLNIKKELEPVLENIINESNSKEETRNLINFNMPIVNEKIKKYTNNYNVNYGLNYFPEKNYKGVTYNEGYYESLVVTLGDGLGDNWWCVLFPPLCLLEAKEDELDDYTYSFFIKDIIDKYL